MIKTFPFWGKLDFSSMAVKEHVVKIEIPCTNVTIKVDKPNEHQI